MPPPPPRLSVVIACHDAADTLGLQLRALAEQLDPPTFEVLVVDNRSTRPPDAIVATWADRLDVRVVRAAAEPGTSYARNVGVACAVADRVVFCDADDCAGPHFLRAADAALGIGDLVTGNVTTVAADAFDATPEAVRASLAQVDPNTPAELGRVDPDYPILMGGASAAHRAALLQLGGFDQAFFPGAEDNDLALRALAAGLRIATAPAMTLAERGRATSAGAFRRSYEAGSMHVRLCAAHDLWSTSPHLHHPSWWLDLVKLPLAAARTAMSSRSPGPRRALASRAGLRLGQATGFARYRLLRRPIRQRLGIGLRVPVN